MLEGKFGDGSEMASKKKFPQTKLNLTKLNLKLLLKICILIRFSSFMTEAVIM